MKNVEFIKSLVPEKMWINQFARKVAQEFKDLAAGFRQVWEMKKEKERRDEEERRLEEARKAAAEKERLRKEVLISIRLAYHCQSPPPTHRTVRGSRRGCKNCVSTQPRRPFVREESATRRPLVVRPRLSRGSPAISPFRSSVAAPTQSEEPVRC